MKKHNLISLIFLAPVALWAQPAGPALSDIDLSDVVMIENLAEPIDSSLSEPAPVSTPALSNGERTQMADDVSSHADEAALSGFGDIAAVRTDEAVTSAANVETPEPAAFVAEPDVALSDVGEVVEIPDAPTAGIVVDVEAPEIAEVATTELPSDSKVVLELPGQETAAGSATMAEEETISVDFPDEDVRTILRNVADLFDLNVVIPDVLQGRTSVKLHNITWRQVFEVVLEPLDFTYVEDRNIIRIKSIADLVTEPVDTRVFILNYAQSSEIQGSISPLIDPAAGGRIQVDKRSNALVITERPSRMNKIQEVIDHLDRATEQVMIETKFIEVTDTNQKNIGVNWSSLEGYGVSGGPFNRTWERARSTIETGSSSTTNSSGLSIPGGFTASNGSSSSDIRDTIKGTSRIDTAVFNADQFNVVISALEQANDSKLVANPTVVTMNNQEATIDIVTEIPQVEYTFNAETGSREADGLAEPLVYGTQVTVTPHVNSAGFIDLHVIPSVSNAIGFKETEVGPQPIIARRTAETTVMIKDGYTLAIGGLTQEEESDGGTSVPILGDLPFLGRLFGSDSTKTEQKNLIIFITAKTLNPDGSNYRDVVDPRVLNQMGLVPAELPGYQLSKEDLATLQELEEFRSQARRAEAMTKNRAELKAIEDARKLKETEAPESAEKAAAAK